MDPAKSNEKQGTDSGTASKSQNQSSDIEAAGFDTTKLVDTTARIKVKLNEKGSTGGGSADMAKVHSKSGVSTRSQAARENPDRPGCDIDGLTQRINNMKIQKSGKDNTDVSKNTALFNKLIDDLKAEKFKHVITLAGAGISTAAGIPDFRTPGTGIYDNLQKFNLPYSQAIFELEYFHEKPEPFYKLAKELFPGTFNPTKSHYFVKLLENKGILLRHYTQNIDNLERFAGVSADKLVEAHGTFFTSHCTKCKKEYSFRWLKNAIETVDVPRCDSCNSVVKPDIVFFGENLPTDFFKTAKTDFKKCDLLIIMGSSLSVQPFASLVTRVGNKCPRLIMNNVPVGSDLGILYGDTSKRDIYMEGGCDSSVENLVRLSGWEADYQKLITAPR